jgi:cytoskeletal protein CcmA (bactofilin family)
MAFFKDTAQGAKEFPPPRDLLAREEERPAPPAALDSTRRPPERTEAKPEVRAPRAEAKESFIAPELSIDGKIEGVGNVRLAGRFKGDVNVQGSLTIEAGAHLTGLVHSQNVTISGELHGNIDGAQRVELLSTAVLVGDVKAGSLTVAAGSRMRGQVEFGWDEKRPVPTGNSKGSGFAT